MGAAAIVIEPGTLVARRVAADGAVDHRSQSAHVDERLDEDACAELRRVAAERTLRDFEQPVVIVVDAADGKLAVNTLAVAQESLLSKNGKGKMGI